MKKTERLKSLSRLSDDELLCRLSDVLKQSRRVESELVAHIAEVDARKLFAREASSSMFQYCLDVMHLSKAESFVRIAAARASRKHPLLLTMLEDGRLHLSGIAVLAPHLTDENCDELLARAPTRRRLRSQKWWPRLHRSRGVPHRRATALHGYGDALAGTWKRIDVDFETSRLVGLIGDLASVRRERGRELPR